MAKPAARSRGRKCQAAAPKRTTAKKAAPAPAKKAPPPAVKPVTKVSPVAVVAAVAPKAAVPAPKKPVAKAVPPAPAKKSAKAPANKKRARAPSVSSVPAPPTLSSESSLSSDTDDDDDDDEKEEKEERAVRAKPAPKLAAKRAPLPPTAHRTPTAAGEQPANMGNSNHHSKSNAAQQRQHQIPTHVQEKEEMVESEQGPDIDLTQRYRQWLLPAQQLAFLAEAEHDLLRSCCRALPHITVRAASSAAFLAVVTHGATPPGSPTLEGKLDGSCPAIDNTPSPLPPPPPLTLSRDHEQAYRTVRNTIAASCVLGHRSCQAVWGPRGSGKHRLIKLVALECGRQPNTLVLQLDGSLLNSDEDAIRTIGDQMLSFLQSPQSEALRAADWSVRTGSFDFGRLMGFDRAIAAAAAEREAEEERQHNSSNNTGGVRGRADASATAAAAAKRRLANTHNEESDDSNEDDDDDDGGGGGPFITSTTGNLVGGAASALPPLQRALLLMKRNCVNIVVCIRQADRFGVWCDQLLYVLAGLMHESDGQGGGMSLLLSSATPDLRQMEKRLSSRLTGETRFVPLLPWTPRRMLRAVLAVLRDLSDCRVALSVAAAEMERRCRAEARRKTTTDPPSHHVRMTTRQSAAKQPLEAPRPPPPPPALTPPPPYRLSQLAQLLSPEWQGKVAAMALVIPDESLLLDYSPGPISSSSSSNNMCGVGVGRARGLQASDRPSATAFSAAVPSLAAHPTLRYEAHAALCGYLLDQLTASTARTAAKSSSSAAAAASGALSPTTMLAAHAAGPPLKLIKRIQDLNEALVSNGATAEVVLAAVVSTLCQAVAGEAIDCLGASGKVAMAAWLDGRQGKEVEWPWLSEASGGGSAAASAAAGGESRAPAAMVQRWMPVTEGGTTPGNNKAGLKGSRPPAHHHLPIGAPLPPDLYDLLDSGELVRLGYASRETVQVLFHVLIQHDAGVRGRSVADLLEDITSAMGTQAAAAVDRECYRLAVRQLCRWRLLAMNEETEAVVVCGSGSRLRDFLRTVLAHRADWCESGVLGLDARDFMRMRSLV